jgi:magnesium-transporting ATPase (P-type)
MMSVLCASAGGAGPRLLLVKGAPESVLERCSAALTNEPGGGAGGGMAEEMTAGLRAALYAKVCLSVRAG